MVKVDEQYLDFATLRNASSFIFFRRIQGLNSIPWNSHQFLLKIGGSIVEGMEVDENKPCGGDSTRLSESITPLKIEQGRRFETCQDFGQEVEIPLSRKKVWRRNQRNLTLRTRHFERAGSYLYRRFFIYKNISV